MSVYTSGTWEDEVQRVKERAVVRIQRGFRQRQQARLDIEAAKGELEHRRRLRIMEEEAAEHKRIERCVHRE